MRTVYATPRRDSGATAFGKGGKSTVAKDISDHSPPVRHSFHEASDVSCRLPVPQSDKLPSGLLPPPLTARLLSALADIRRRGYSGLPEEIRLRAGRYATLTVGGYNCPTDILLSSATLSDLLVHLCGGSLYAYSDSIHQGYITLPGGIRVGVAGRAVCEEGKIIGVTDITGLSIRLPHPHRAVGGTICRLLRHFSAAGNAQGVLIYAPPGVGKTTLLRAVAATMASGPTPWRTVVVDTRGELGFDTDRSDLCLDVLTGYPRARGVEIGTRTLSAELIVCDEIGDVEEAMSLISAHHGGVPLVASAHAGSPEELLRRTGIRLLHEARLFGAYVGIRRQSERENGFASPAEGASIACASGSASDTMTPPPCDVSPSDSDRSHDLRIASEVSQNPKNCDFDRDRHRGRTVAPPRKTAALFAPKNACCPDSTADYLYRITPWADAERLMAGG